MSHTKEQVAEIECLYQLGYTRKNRTDKLLENGLIQFCVDNRFLSARTFSRKIDKDKLYSMENTSLRS